MRVSSARIWAWATTGACCFVISTRSRVRRAFPSGRTLLPDPTPTTSTRRSPRVTPYGTPDEVARAIQKYADAGVDQVVFGLLSSTMERELAVETIETFGKHVLPAVRHGSRAPHDPSARSGRRQLVGGRNGRACG